MNFNIENFVGVFEDAFSEEYCAGVIKHYDQLAEMGFSLSRQQAENTPRVVKDDYSIALSLVNDVDLKTSTRLAKTFNDVFWGDCYKKYAEKFSVLTQNSATHTSYYFKIQKTPIGGGYHIWHYESYDRPSSSRLLAWMLYLNEVEEGGETEFLYYPKRIKPKTGTLLIWPAAFSHTHRGNPPLSNPKYVVTGWVEF
jgi:hypothetical protein